MNWREHLRRLLALRCEESSLLASHELDEPLGTPDRLAMWGHLLACRSCRRLRNQFRRIGEVYRRREACETEARSEGNSLSPDSRRRIAEVLRSATNDGNPERNGGSPDSGIQPNLPEP